MKSICNHMVFLDAEARNDLHEGKEVEGQGYATIIDMTAKNLDFSSVHEVVTKYKINSNSKKNEVYMEEKFLDDLDHNNFVNLNFNSKKLKINIDDILDLENNGKEKIDFVVIEKNKINYISIVDINLLKKNYVFYDELNNFLEQERI